MCGKGGVNNKEEYVTVQSQAKYLKMTTHACMNVDIYNILFGGYATPRKHTVFSRLALNSYKNVKIRMLCFIMKHPYYGF